MTTTLANSFDIQQSTTQPTLILPQKLGTKLWAPMFAMSLMGFAAGFGIHLAKAAAVSDRAAAVEIARLAHYGTAAMFMDSHQCLRPSPLQSRGSSEPSESAEEQCSSAQTTRP